MSRGEELASRFREAYVPVRDFIESTDAQTWTAFVPAEAATVGAVMNHVAQSMRYNGSVLKSFRVGTPPVQLTQEMIDTFNEAEKQQAAAPDRGHVLEALRTGVDRISVSLAATSDAAFESPTRIEVGDHVADSLEQWTLEVMLPHGTDHLDSCLTALG